MYYLSKIILPLCCYCLVFTACKRTESVVKQNNLKERETDLLSKTTIERLVALQEGSFVMHDSSGTIPFVMQSGDSLCMYSKQFGVPNRDGYWLYQKMYMSSVPDAPLSMEFLKITKISRDSFYLEQFDADKKFKYADREHDLLKEVNFNKMNASGCNVIFEKVGQLEFKGQTPICDMSYEGGGEQIFVNKLLINMNGIQLASDNYKKEAGKNVYVNTTYGYFK